MDELTVGIYVPSYNRYDKIRTQEIFENCTYMVRESQKKIYEEAGVRNIWSVEDSLIDDGCKAYWYIINNAKEDIIVIADDDIDDMQYMLDRCSLIKKDKEIITSEIYRIAQLIYDLKVGLASITPKAIPYEYDKEFAFFGICGSIKWFNKEVFKAKYDKKVDENFDIDMVLQELLLNRICLFPKYLHDKGAPIDKNSGGNSNRRRKDQIDSFHEMKRKWGKYYQYDFNKNKPKINVTR